MAPLFEKPRLIPCPSCGLHIKRSEPQCPHCEARLGGDGMAGASLVLGPLVLGLSLSGCTDDGSTDDDGAGTGNMTAAMTAADDGDDGSTAADDGATGMVDGTQGSTGLDESGTGMADTFSDDAEYGVPDTGAFTEDDGGTSGGESDSGDSTDGGSDSGSSDDIGEPEYGVATTTGFEPLYGAGVSDEGPG